MSSRSSDNQSSIGPLSIGNLITAALGLYRNNFKTYFILALKAAAWTLVPLFGWAKYSALLAVISRLAYTEVTKRPESSLDAQKAVQPFKWSLLGTLILIVLMISAVFIVLTVGLGVIGGILIAVLNVPKGTASKDSFNVIFNLLGTQPIWGSLVLLIGFIFFFFLLYIFLRIIFRYSLFELVIGVEREGNIFKSLYKSSQLTKGFFVRVQLAFLIAFLVSLPAMTGLYIVNAAVNQIFNHSPFSNPSPYPLFVFMIIFVVFHSIINPIFVTSNWMFSLLTSHKLSLYTIVNFSVYLLAVALVIPFWNSFKALLYYDIKVRKEGIDIKDRLL